VVKEISLSQVAGLMLRNGQINKAIGSFFTSNREVVRAHEAGELEMEVLPLGNLAEAIRAGGVGSGRWRRHGPRRRRQETASGHDPLQ